MRVKHKIHKLRQTLRNTMVFGQQKPYSQNQQKQKSYSHNLEGGHEFQPLDALVRRVEPAAESESGICGVQGLAHGTFVLAGRSDKKLLIFIGKYLHIDWK